eukprot:tig00021621_g22965.t1
MASEAFAVAAAAGSVQRRSGPLPRRSAGVSLREAGAKKLALAPVQRASFSQAPRVTFSVSAQAERQAEQVDLRFEVEEKIPAVDQSSPAPRPSTPALRALPATPNHAPHEYVHGDVERAKYVLQRIDLKARELDRVATRLGLSEECSGLPQVAAMPPGASATHFLVMAKLAREVRGALAYYRLSAQQLFEYERDLDVAVEAHGLPDDVVSSARSMLASMQRIVEEGRRGCEAHRERTIRALRQKIVRGEALVAARDEAIAAGLPKKQRVRVVTEALARVGTGSKKPDAIEEVLPPFEPSMLGMARGALEKIRSPAKCPWEEEIPECLLWRMFNQEQSDDFLERETLHRWIRLGQDVWDERLSLYPAFKEMQQKRFRQVVPVAPTLAAVATFAAAAVAAPSAADAIACVMQSAAASGAAAAVAGAAALPAANLYSFMSVPWAAGEQEQEQAEQAEQAEEELGPMSFLGIREFFDNYHRLMHDGPDAVPAGRRRGRALINAFDAIKNVGDALRGFFQPPGSAPAAASQ